MRESTRRRDAACWRQQSQRVTRRSPSRTTVFHPVPEQIAQATSKGSA
jgi:hypothetical protein